MLPVILAAHLLSVTPACQTPAPGPAWVCQDGGWLPPGHPAIRPTAPPPPDTRPSFCVVDLNPYERPDLAAICSAWDAEHRPRPPLPEFVAQATYRDPYDDRRILVLAVAATMEGIPLVVAQRIRPLEMAGMVLCFRVDSIEAQRWSRVF